MRHFVTDSTGQVQFDPDSLPASYTYDGSNRVLTESVTYGASVFVKTYTYTGSNLTSESAWVKQ
ncbi:hypothetical protein PQQ63_15425 [Paraburkholderia metrosideri]|uniref:YD repeat-containing protein n=1 Tax=Paraburkholderia metrosideri TaxID=580937 RepID=A0ABW9DTT9_9BURK